MQTAEAPLALTPALAPRATGTGSRTLTAQAITHFAPLQRLATEWEALWRRVPSATPFQSPRWLLPWWRHVGRGELAAVAVRHEASGELLGMAPLYAHHEPRSGVRQLLPIGVATSDDLDCLAAAGWSRDVLRCVRVKLADTSAAWDVLEVPQLGPGATLPGLPVPAGWRLQLACDEPHPVLALGSDAAALPRHMAQNLRTARSRAGRLGRLRIDEASPLELADWLDALRRLHARRWNARGSEGVLQGEGLHAWHREAMPQMLAAGLLRPFWLHLDGECLAAACVLADGSGSAARRWHYYIGGFDPQHAAISPGALLLDHAIAQARAEGASAFDFLRGAEGYKYRWGARNEARWVLRLWNERQPEPT